jgi:ribonuclease P protein component
VDLSTGSATFPRAARLQSPPQYQAVFSRGRRLNEHLFRLHVHLLDMTNAGEMNPPTLSTTTKADAIYLARLGISVPKRVAAHAVERNRIRRIARESFRHLRHQLPPGDYVLLAQRASAGASAQVLRESLSSLWCRAAALKLAGAAPTMLIPAPAAADTDQPFSPTYHR